MIIFKKTPDPNNKFDMASTEMKLPDGVTMDDVIEQFELFLKSMGYPVPEKSNLDWVEEE